MAQATLVEIVGGCALRRSPRGAIECLREKRDQLVPLEILHVGDRREAVFRPNAESMRERALAKGELDDLRLAIEYHLAHDDTFLRRAFDRSLAELVQEEQYRPEWALKRILAFIHNTLWPDASPVEHAPEGTVMVDVPLDEWRARRLSR